MWLASALTATASDVTTTHNELLESGTFIFILLYSYEVYCYHRALLKKITKVSMDYLFLPPSETLRSSLWSNREYSHLSLYSGHLSCSENFFEPSPIMYYTLIFAESPCSGGLIIIHKIFLIIMMFIVSYRFTGIRSL